MNILPFVFAVLFILSYGIGASLQNQIASHRNQKANLGLLRAERKFLQDSELEQYKNLPGVELKSEKGEKSTSLAKEEPSNDVPFPKINPSCARLNLFPLIDEGKEAHLPLYETAAKLLRTFYQAEVFGNEKRFEYKLLDNLLASAKKQLEVKDTFPLETLSLKDTSLQPVYYILLKGIVKRFPSLLDYIKIERPPSQICLFHAHPKIMTVFFGEKTASRLYQELHGERKAAIGLEAILQWAHDPHLAFVDAKVWELIDFQRPKHGSSSQKTLVAEDEESHISIRKNIQLKATL
jgi:hypothetical protein